MRVRVRAMLVGLTTSSLSEVIVLIVRLATELDGERRRAPPLLGAAPNRLSRRRQARAPHLSNPLLVVLFPHHPGTIKRDSFALL
jgi:hypothetical protein